MSVAAHSPCYGHKRLFEHADSSPDLVTSHKRLRRLSASPHGRREPQLAENPAHALASTAKAALCGLFPEMDEQVVSDVLSSCGDNIETAIQRLGELRLTANCRSSYDNHSSPGKPMPQPVTGQSLPETAAQPTVQENSARTLQDWVHALVSQMGEAQGLDDARARASHVLQAFQQAVAAAQAKETSSMAQARLGELTRENGILKRAVAIQAQRISESGNAANELAGLKAQLAQYEAKVHSLELANYSLGMHLRAATSEANLGLANGRPPDVF